jgi:hypothetical protein
MGKHSNFHVLRLKVEILKLNNFPDFEGYIKLLQLKKEQLGSNKKPQPSTILSGLAVAGIEKHDAALSLRSPTYATETVALCSVDEQHILFVPPIPQQILISVNQPYAGPAASCCGIIGTHRKHMNEDYFNHFCNIPFTGSA